MTIPDSVRQGLREKLWALADKLDWSRLTWYEKSALYEEWTRDSDIGGLLLNYIDGKRVRVYIKDTIMKGYVRARQADPWLVFRALGIKSNVEILRVQERPHGRVLADGRVIVWGNADDWKLVLMAVHERAFDVKNARRFAAVLMASAGKFNEVQVRAMVQDAADKLSIERLVWIT